MNIPWNTADVQRIRPAFYHLSIRGCNHAAGGEQGEIYGLAEEKHERTEEPFALPRPTAISPCLAYCPNTATGSRCGQRFIKKNFSRKL
jgi:hypothetical protein